MKIFQEDGDDSDNVSNDSDDNDEDGDGKQELISDKNTISA